ncbi:MAG: glycoside hydrolase family 9 protein [Kiritimatiellae bacterium]|nr:glycoside hydrolase family 9 protein [Kiritimatiellia bacterium]
MKNWRIHNASDDSVVFESPSAPLLRVKDEIFKGVYATGEETYEMDFSSFTQEGEFYIAIDGVGRSENFLISSTSAEDAFRVHMQGLYQKRYAIAKELPYTHWQSKACHQRVTRGTFAPDEGKLEPGCKWFDVIRENTNWDGGEKITAIGGWHDAADYDRRPQHLKIVNDLCAVYIMKKENFRDNQLLIPENANGIADILDEAEWGLRHILAAQQPDGGAGTWIEGTRHPRPGNIASTDGIQYAVSKATRRSSLMYAANAAILSRCNETFRKKYLESAIRAWQFAVTTRPRTDVFEIKKTKHRYLTETSLVYWHEDENLPTEYLVKAAVNLSALTGDKSYIEYLMKNKSKLLSDVKVKSWNWPALLYSAEMALGTPSEMDDYFKAWKTRVQKQADEICAQMENSYAYRIPWPKISQKKADAMGWGESHPLRRAQYLIAAHGISGNIKYLDAASLANDFHNGCNMQGTTYTSGLGKVYPVKFLDLPSYVDDVAEYTPGITPYRWTKKIPPRALELVWSKDEKRASCWPVWRRWWNLEYQTVAASEFTVWETIAPAASVTAYLITPSNTTPPPARVGEKDITKLGGYWLLP